MKIRKSGHGGEVYRVESSKKGEFYNVDLDKMTCRCPHFMFRLRQRGEICKHITAVRQMLQNEHKDDFEKALDRLRESSEMDSIEFIGEFSEGVLAELIERGEVVEEHGIVRIIS